VSAEPLTREERDQFSPWGVYASSEEACAKAFARYEATVQAAEERAERLRECVIRMSSYDAVAREYLAADDLARGES